jgi:zinc transport system ATP-binding protein
MPPALTVAHLSVRFGPKTVLDDLSFSVPAGSALAVIGPNGSGKTVLFQALIGAVPSEGTIRWAPGTRIGYVPQKLDLERDLPISGRDFLRAKAHVSHATPADLARAMEIVNLSPAVMGQPIGTLSGGQFQRLLLAFALMGRPTVLLFDEPTASVDAPGEEGLYTTLERLQQAEHMTLLFISHELSLVYHRADTVLCLSPFRGAGLGPPLEILTPERLQEAYGVPLKFHVADGHDGHAG